MLVDGLTRLNLPEGARVFVPLCGKTLDIGWLRSRGLRVAGVELSEVAVTQLFADLAVMPDIRRTGLVTGFHAPGLDIFVGDILDLGPGRLGPFDAVYDRAALVALPEAMRQAYAAHLAMLSDRAPHLLVTFDYDRSAMDGPPFPVPEAEVRRLYGDGYDLVCLAEAEVEGGLKGRCPAREIAWHLVAKGTSGPGARAGGSTQGGSTQGGSTQGGSTPLGGRISSGSVPA